jgi:hypothetical protein
MGEPGSAQEYVLFCHDVAGSPHVERFPSLPTAVQRVEQLANDEGVTDCELFALDPVRLQRQQRWHVVVAAQSPVPAPRAATPPAAPPKQASPLQVRSEQVQADHTDAVDVEVLDEVFHQVTTGDPTHEATESADVLPSSPRGRGLGFFVHQ